jgi:oxygen-independent coproporphyrinogen-3 oxidase
VLPQPDRWRSPFAAATWLEALDGLARRAQAPIALGVHLPLCTQRCAYCAHEVSPIGDGTPIDRHLDALELELSLLSAALDARREVVRLHVGGGTPNLLDEAQFDRLRAIIDRHLRWPADAESSIDCDPRRSSRAQFEHLRALGFRHVRFGMADLAPAVQLACGRIHSAALLADAVGNAQSCGFDSVQVDLVCGLPAQDLAGLAATTEALVAIGPDRVRCLRYLHDPANHPVQRGVATDPPADPAAMFAFAAHALRAAGYHAIGDGCFVLDGDEWLTAREAGGLVRCVDGYSAQPFEDQLAVGPGRTSDVGGVLARNAPLRGDWQHRLNEGRLPVVAAHRRTPFQMRQRAALDHLYACHELPSRLVAGGLETAWAGIAAHTRDGWVRCAPDRLLLTEDGECQLDRLAEPIVNARPANGA